MFSYRPFKVLMQPRKSGTPIKNNFEIKLHQVYTCPSNSFDSFRCVKYEHQFLPNLPSRSFVVLYLVNNMNSLLLELENCFPNIILIEFVTFIFVLLLETN